MRQVAAIMTILMLGGALAACSGRTGGPATGASSSAPDASGQATKGDTGAATHN